MTAFTPERIAAAREILALSTGPWVATLKESLDEIERLAAIASDRDRAQADYARKSREYDQAVHDLCQAKAERDEAIAVLTEIAMFADAEANDWLAMRGSYSQFDEPGSVQTARSFLSRMEGRKDG